MSYLSLPRIAFSGRFQSDVSTVNNDVRHYDNTSFQSRFQEPQASNQEMNGWWNPRGTGAFRLVNVAVCQSVLTPGDSGASDPATGLYLNAQIERTAAKMVDLDPQFQMGSALWGLRVALTDGKTEYMRGDYLAAPFRDLFFGRVNRLGGSGNASAKYTSVLENVEWSAAADQSPVLSALRAAALVNANRLSVNFMTFGYVGNSSSQSFTYGNLTGSIGTWEEGSPKKFVQGRRFAPVLSGGPFSNRSNIGFFDCEISNGAVSLDLSNALPLASTTGSMIDLGALHVAVLRDGDVISNGTITPGVTEDSSIPLAQIVDIGNIDYLDPDWLMSSAGIVDLILSDEARSLAETHPLALVTPEQSSITAEIRIRETMAGLFLRADTMEMRVDAQPAVRVAENTTVLATQYGKPVSNLPVVFALNTPESGQGNSGQTNPPNQFAPTAPTPDIGTPPDKVHFSPSGMTDANGEISVAFGFDDPGNPRGYIDGQIYKVNYSIDYSGVSDMPLFDQIVIHLRDAYVPPTNPDWTSDIAPILVQYGNLYPIMSHGLFSFSDEAVIKSHARIMAFALTRDLADPNHMPATRDLSEGKRQAILNWLGQFLTGDERTNLLAGAMSVPDFSAALANVPDTTPPIAMHSTRVGEIPEQVATGSDGKTKAVRDMLSARLNS